MSNPKETPSKQADGNPAREGLAINARCPPNFGELRKSRRRLTSAEREATAVEIFYLADLSAFLS